ncbi:hypothetical protein K503DRAFT_776159 [Rhizopogon vinicolor AM-OR11-026]|uniref:Uncharacterized protein n=1 Tax=Rhizopogon vinicolor AM-OR11-026 TaxID=1314800 RepID=A0A1B7MK18_9AGAM|nr:hypothetical protein K503DRAFT_776159 [Rhizopogon vinicolor AM-OR11-026]
MLIVKATGVSGQILLSYISSLMAEVVAKNVVVYEMPKQTRAVMAATATGQLNTILTFYEISDLPILSPLSGIPIPLLRRAITILMRSNRAQIIGVVDGEGVRFFAATK